MGVKKGDKAKDFTLSDHDGKEIRLSDPIAQLPDIEEIITVLESS